MNSNAFKFLAVRELLASAPWPLWLKTQITMSYRTAVGYKNITVDEDSQTRAVVAHGL